MHSFLFLACFECFYCFYSMIKSIFVLQACDGLVNCSFTRTAWESIPPQPPRVTGELRNCMQDHMAHISFSSLEKQEKSS